MFERFTEHARQVVVLSQEEAVALRHGHIGTEHLLLGLLREEKGLAAQVLASLNIVIGEVRPQIVRIVGEGHEQGAIQMLPFTPQAKKVLELSLREALHTGHNHIGTEHILLALVRANDGVATQILLDLGADAELIRTTTLARLQDRSSESRGGIPIDDPEAGRWIAYTPAGPTPAWEYSVAQTGDLSPAWLNERGAEGWELVSVVPAGADHLAIFKRPVA